MSKWTITEKAGKSVAGNVVHDIEKDGEIVYKDVSYTVAMHLLSSAMAPGDTMSEYYESSKRESDNVSYEEYTKMVKEWDESD